jgi:hypothetical protein
VSTQLLIESQLVLSTPASQKEDFKVQLARDLAYNGIAMDDETLENFIYEELQKRLGARTAHVRKSPFKESVKKTYTTKNSSKKSSKSTRHCSNCGKEGHSKNKCTKGTKGTKSKKSKKINHAHRSESEDSNSSEEESSEEESSQSEQSSSDNDDEEDRNCNAVKKKWSEMEYL